MTCRRQDARAAARHLGEAWLVAAGHHPAAEPVPTAVHAPPTKSKTSPATSTPVVTTAAPPAGQKYASTSSFIRAQPLERPVKDVVAEGAKLGLNVKANLVYMIRSRLKSGGAPKVARRAKPTVQRSPRALPTAPPAAAAYKQAALRVGLDQAKLLLAELEAGVQALVGG